MVQICWKKNLINFVVEFPEHRLGICLVCKENFDRDHHLELKKFSFGNCNIFLVTINHCYSVNQGFGRNLGKKKQEDYF